MTIAKFIHSCVLLEQDGYRILFDPGTFTFADGRVRPEDIPAPDLVIITHEHRDHVDPDALEILVRPKAAEILVPSRYAGPEPAGISVLRIDDTDELQRGPFNLQGVDAPHGELPGSVPANVGVLVNDLLLNPGDALSPNIQKCEVLLLPIYTPWATLAQSVAMVERFRPRLVIPIHDGVFTDFALQSQYERRAQLLTLYGAEFRPLGLGESLKLD